MPIAVAGTLLTAALHNVTVLQQALLQLEQTPSQLEQALLQRKQTQTVHQLFPKLTSIMPTVWSKAVSGCVC